MKLHSILHFHYQIYFCTYTRIIDFSAWCFYLHFFQKKIKVWNNKKWHMAAINEIWSSLKSVVGLPSYWNWHLSVSPQFPWAALEKQTLHRLHCLSLQTSPLPSSPCPAHTGLLQNLVLPRGLHTCCSLCLEHWPPEPQYWWIPCYSFLRKTFSAS